MADSAERMTLVMPLSQDPQIIGPGAKSVRSATTSVRSSAEVLASRVSSRSILKKNSAGIFSGSQLPDSLGPAGDAGSFDIDEILGPEGQEDFKADDYPLKRTAPWQIPNEMGQFSNEPFSLRVRHGKDHYENLRRAAQNQLLKDIKPESPPASRVPELYHCDDLLQGGGSSPKSSAAGTRVRSENRARKSMRRLREKLVESSWEAFGPQMLSMFTEKTENKVMAEKKHKLSIAKHMAKLIFTQKVQQMRVESKAMSEFNGASSGVGGRMSLVEEGDEDDEGEESMSGDDNEDSYSLLDEEV
eukprot:gnl/MRDRNA2_/MRDRNA2_139597_c0_seq1.p1 gnl/MRDRNA2_/MRDRNA2_139597_c0~~gnl/MRDRNA2_/MRDRNA2_139597_c0_seq1.p1  ORF type:complete len:332 (-),score=65.54 gnl/MRDRNA2_/MRDRNA2_139597_c0_seq1:3-908(-)